MLETKCTSANRRMILHVLQNELQKPVITNPSPGFESTVGNYHLLRDGRIITPEDEHGIFEILASLKLCDTSYNVEQPDINAIYSLTEEHNGRTLLNLFSIISARQQLLNKALAANKAFYISPQLMNHLLSHPPLTTESFLQALYGKNDAYKGIHVNLSYVVLSGFDSCDQKERHIHRQLGEHIFHAALSLKWIKPFTRNVRNKKYYFRSWLNSIGMVGPEYEEARTVLLGRLYGKSGQRIIRK